MNYFALMSEAIDYIEDNLNRNISVEELANRYHISKYYFIRIFKALTNQTVKEYVNKRRLTEAAKALQNKDKRVIDVAFEYGYESHEVFTRSFKKLFSMTPNSCRKDQTVFTAFPKMEIVERDLINKNKDLIVEFKIWHRQALVITGQSMGYNPADQTSIDKLKPFASAFFNRYNKIEKINRFYNAALSDTEKDQYSFFAGYEKTECRHDEALEKLVLPESDYAVFLYRRELGDIHTTVMKDICRSIMTAQMTLNKIGIDFVVVFEEDYFATNQYAICVPILLDSFDRF